MSKNKSFRSKRKFNNRETYKDAKSASNKKFEEYVIVLDYLPEGHAESRAKTFKTEPIIQAIGVDYFTLLELVPRKSHKSDIKIKDKLYIGSGHRDKIDHIKGRISYDELTATAKFEIDDTILHIIHENEQKFVDFFNNARSITTKMHQLELIPGIGKKLMWEIINERKKGNFKSFKDIRERVSKIGEPDIMIKKRILMELQNADKYYLFIRHPFEK
ncbi:MAG: DUF655 domain-containing protein [Candidatus Helarchaeota archaeon]